MCVYVCVCVCMYVCMYGCVCMYVCMCMYVSCIRILIRTYVRMFCNYIVYLLVGRGKLAYSLLCVGIPRFPNRMHRCS